MALVPCPVCSKRVTAVRGRRWSCPDCGVALRKPRRTAAAVLAALAVCAALGGVAWLAVARRALGPAGGVRAAGREAAFASVKDFAADLNGKPDVTDVAVLPALQAPVPPIVSVPEFPVPPDATPAAAFAGGEGALVGVFLKVGGERVELRLRVRDCTSPELADRLVRRWKDTLARTQANGYNLRPELFRASGRFMIYADEPALEWLGKYYALR